MDNDDLLHRPASALLSWCLPLAAGFSGNWLLTSNVAIGAIWAVAFVWMGTACLINAVRCHRVHCYIAGPAFLVGAAVQLSVVLGAGWFGRHAASNAESATLLAVLLSFIPEMLWGRYR